MYSILLGSCLQCIRNLVTLYMFNKTQNVFYPMFVFNPSLSVFYSFLYFYPSLPVFLSLLICSSIPPHLYSILPSHLYLYPFSLVVYPSSRILSRLTCTAFKPSLPVFLFCISPHITPVNVSLLTFSPSLLPPHQYFCPNSAVFYHPSPSCILPTHLTCILSPCSSSARTDWPTMLFL